MDYRPDLNGLSVTRGVEAVVAADQAVFTSIRSPTGEGYRLIAASQGVRAEEKVEITRRSPSHGSLCEQGAEALGLSAYPLESGRYCVASSRYAGTEHTARGGGRVYTHIVLLDRQSYLRCLCNPLRVHEAVDAAVGGASPLLKPPYELPMLSLNLSWQTGADSARDPRVLGASPDLEPLWHLASALMDGRRLVAVAERNPVPTVEWALLSLPLALRERLSISVGLKFSPSRQLSLTVLTDCDPGANRAIRGHDIGWLDLAALPASRSAAYDPWFALLGRWWDESRFAEFRSLSSRISFPADATALERIAQLCNELDRVDSAAVPELAALISHYGRAAGRNDVEESLLEQIVELAKCRMAALEARSGQSSPSSSAAADDDRDGSVRNRLS